MKPPRLRPTEWVRLYRCPDEMTAITLQAELKGYGIISWVRSLEIPAYAGLVRSARSFWGYLLVDRSDLLRSRRIIEEFFADLEIDWSGHGENA